MLMTRVCSKCGETKPLAEYARHESSADGRKTRCKVCNNARNKAWRSDPANKAREREKRARRYAEDPEYRRQRDGYRRKYLYGVSVDQFEEMIRDQGGRCLLCGRAFGEKPRDKPALDHCHKTGRVRGVLHLSCNSGLGNFDDDPLLLTLAAIYLHRIG